MAIARVLIGVFVGVLTTLLSVEQADHVFEVSRVHHVQSRLISDATVPEDGYASALQALIAASNRSNPDSIAFDREHVGAIVKCEGKGYFYTHGVGEPGQAPVTFSVLKPRPCKVVALWHTHGGEAHDREFFSPADTDAANRLGKPIYMTNHTGKLYVYEPGAPTITRVDPQYGSLRIPRGMSAGRVVRDSEGRLIRIRRDYGSGVAMR